MEIGDRIAGRWRLESRLAAPRGGRRWSVVDLETGEALEAVGLQPGSLQATRDQFLEVHEALHRAGGLGAPLAVVDGPNSAWVVRPAVPSTLEQAGRLSPGAGAAVGAMLLQAVPPPLLLAGIRPRDVALSDVGIWLAPSGPPPTVVERSTLMPPSVSSHEAAVAHLVHRLVSGRTLQSKPDTGSRPLDEALTRLLDGEPDGAEALTVLADPSAPETQPSGPTQVDEPRPRVHQPDSGGFPVIITARALARSTPAERSAIAGAARAPAAWIDNCASVGAPVVVATAATQRQARDLARSLTEELGVDVHVHRGAGPLVWLALLSVLGGSSAALVLAAAILFTGLSPLGALAALLFGLTLLPLVVPPARRLGETAPVAPPRLEGNVELLQRRIADVRRALSTVDIADAAAQDLRGRLRELDRQVGALAASDPAAALQLVDVELLEAHGSQDLQADHAAGRLRQTDTARNADIASLNRRLDVIGSALADASRVGLTGLDR